MSTTRVVYTTRSAARRAANPELTAPLAAPEATATTGKKASRKRPAAEAEEPTRSKGKRQRVAAAAALEADLVADLATHALEHLPATIKQEEVVFFVVGQAHDLYHVFSSRLEENKSGILAARATTVAAKHPVTGATAAVTLVALPDSITGGAIEPVCEFLNTADFAPRIVNNLQTMEISGFGAGVGEEARRAEQRRLCGVIRTASELRLPAMFENLANRFELLAPWAGEELACLAGVLEEVGPPYEGRRPRAEDAWHALERMVKEARAGEVVVVE